MSEKTDIQREILKELHSYSEYIIPGVEMLIQELRENREEDTEELFTLVIQGINWEIEVFNSCEEVINREGQQVDKTRMASAVVRLGKVLQEKDDIKLAAALEVDFLPFLKSMEKAASSTFV